MELQGKRVLITGASRGIGRSIAHAMAGSGAHVALLARDAAALEALAAELGGTAHPTDLLDASQREGLLERIEGDVGPIDVLVNNAGIGSTGAHWDTTAADVTAQVELNLLTPLELCRQAVPLMIQRGRGHLVNVASLAAVASVPGMTTYAATKAGLSHGTSALRDELKGLPIGVTTVLVGGVPTDLLHQGEEYAPFHRAFDRLRRIQLSPDTAADTLAAAVVRGVERGTRTVYLPRRAAPFVGFVEAPRKIVKLALLRVPRRA
jgi:short-subunit dehydrogenase